MCFGVRFSLYLASWLSDFGHLFSVCVVFGPLVFSPENGGGGKAPLPPPLDPRLSRTKYLSGVCIYIYPYTSMFDVLFKFWAHCISSRE